MAVAARRAGEFGEEPDLSANHHRLEACDAFRAAAGLEFAEVLRSRWLLFSFALYTVLATIFVFVGMRESNVMGFTGMGRVLFAFCHALVQLLPLLGLTATGQTVTQAREDGSLELLFSHRLSRARWRKNWNRGIWRTSCRMPTSISLALPPSDTKSTSRPVGAS